MAESEWTPPSWMYRNSRPPNDGKYFENMTRVIFQAGLSWKTIEKKWPNFRKAFKNFSIEKVAKLKETDVEKLKNNKDIIRNKSKIEATISNAKEFKKIKKESGSFQKFLDSLDKTNNYAIVIKELSKRFKRLGSSSAFIFLYSVGEDIKHSV